MLASGFNLKICLTSASTWTPSALACVMVLPRPGASYAPIVRPKYVNVSKLKGDGSNLIKMSIVSWEE